MVNLGNYRLHRYLDKSGNWHAILTTEIEIPNETAEAIMNLDGNDVPRAMEEALRKVFNGE